ncbi:MAG: hypothetical protein WBA16_04980 [Nonlabens sp.]
MRCKWSSGNPAFAKAESRFSNYSAVAFKPLNNAVPPSFLLRVSQTD